MNTDQMVGLVGGIFGSVIGIAGGLIGTYFSIKRTDGPKERAFMIKASFVCWLAITLFLALVLAVPRPYVFFFWILYGILLPLGIIYCNRAQQRIRKEETQHQSTPPPP